MKKINVSIAGANTLLGQHLLARFSRDKSISVKSLHDALGSNPQSTLKNSQQWQVGPQVAEHFSHTPLLPADAPALAPIMLSFLPDNGAEEIEEKHLDRGTRLITHCEYARLSSPLALPGITKFDIEARQLATPNCTTAICALPLHQLHQAFGISHVTITTLQAISGTDIPGMPAHTIHDQVIGHLHSETEALSQELSVIFNNDFGIDSFATRVPVWRGHTITMSITLASKADFKAVTNIISQTESLVIKEPPTTRDYFSPHAPLTTITNLRVIENRVLMVIKGDNLEAATAGVMQSIAHMLDG